MLLDRGEWLLVVAAEVDYGLDLGVEELLGLLDHGMLHGLGLGGAGLGGAGFLRCGSGCGRAGQQRRALGCRRCGGRRG